MAPRKGSGKGTGRRGLPQEQTEEFPPGARVINDVIAQKLHRQAGIAKSQREAANGEYGAILAKHKESHGLNVPMFKMAVKFRDKADDDPVKARTDYDDFQFYCDVLGLEDAMSSKLPGIDDGPAQRRHDTESFDADQPTGDPEDAESSVTVFPGRHAGTA